MSIFSKIKQGRKAAKHHMAKKEENKDHTEPTKVPYKHVPTHAAVDALSGAPSSWKHEDQPKIKEYHQRRSQMTISRTQSTLCAVSSANTAARASSVPDLPRTSSYNSYNPTWFDRGGDVYHEPVVSRRQQKGRGHYYHDSGIGASIGPSPLASNVHSENVSPVESSGNSITSDSDQIEIKNPFKRPTLEIPSSSGSGSKRSSSPYRPQPVNFAEKDIFDRLHTSTTRKLGEAPLFDAPPAPTNKQTASYSTVTREQKQKQRKPRWSLLGKKNCVPVAA